MKNYEVTSVYATVHSGTVRVSPQQAAAREHALKPLDRKKGLYEVTAPTGFKRGEVFGFDGQVNKTMLKDVEDTDERGKRQGRTAAAGRKKAEAPSDAPTEEPEGE